MKPNLFIIGAMKSGTSSLHRYLGEHPEIFMCEPKEPAFFAAEASRVADEAHYLELFASAGSVRYVGESSTHYSKYPRFPDVVERITGFAPHARFIYLMRDPVERSISHYWHMVRWHGERRGILKAMQAEPDFVDFSNYPLQLKQWMKECSTEQLFVDSFECMLRDPKAFCSRVFEWLEVDPGFQPKGTGEVHND